MVLQLMFFILVPALLVAAAGWDLATYKIPNAFSAALLLLFVVFAGIGFFSTDAITPGLLGWHAAAMGVGLLAGILLFALGWVGGGDAKLFAAACLWLGWDALLHYVVFASLFGGGLTIGILMLRKMPLPVFLTTHGWIARLTDRRAGIPYGVALAAGALASLPASDLFRVALAS
jgi:prepilin peptidase CpaA